MVDQKDAHTTPTTYGSGETSHKPSASERRYAVLLTATVNPGLYAPQLQRNDPTIRLGDYQKALSWWGQLADPRIGALVFCDNSGYDLSSLRKTIESLPFDVELLSFNGNEHPPGTHYGYAELGLIDYALAHSEILRDEPHFIKATGRLLFNRLPKLLDNLRIDFDALVDHRSRYRHETGPSTRARTQLMLFRTEFYRDHLQNSRTEMLGTCSHIEEFLAIKLESLTNSTVIRRFPVECPPFGIGGNGSNYNALTTQSKNYLRALARSCLPSVWL